MLPIMIVVLFLVYETRTLVFYPADVLIYMLNVLIDDLLFFFKQKTAYEMRISDWSSDVCSSDLFAVKHCRNLVKRIGYNYFLRDLSIASLELVAAIMLLGFGTAFGGWHWWHAGLNGQATPVGTIMIATVSVVSGLQLDRKSTRLNSSH